MSLFRPEVQQAQAAQWLGSVHLHRPLSFAVLPEFDTKTGKTGFSVVSTQ